MTTPKPIASLSLDLDNKWSYLKTHGDPAWQRLPSYLDVVVPRVLDILKARNLTVTMFIVGQDAAVAKNRELLRAIAAAGHEIGNHSFHHEPWLHLYSEARTETELERAEEHIERATGRRPLGFRGPGFSLSAASVRVLARRGYRYDASTLPTFLGPLARAYYFMRTRLTPEQREQRKLLFGTFAEGAQPLGPYRWHTDAGELLEIPVTTMPIFRTPFHVSYLLYLSAVAPRLAVGYFRAVLALCRWTGTEPDRKSTRLNSSHTVISYAVFCLKKKKKIQTRHRTIQIKLRQIQRQDATDHATHQHQPASLPKPPACSYIEHTDSPPDCAHHAET